MRSGTVICDLDGVVYRGEAAIPGSADALARLEEMGYTLVFATNNSSWTRGQAAAKIERVTGYPARGEQVASSAGAAATILGDPPGAALVVGAAGIVEAVEEVGWTVAAPDQGVPDAVVVGIDFGLTYDTLRVATTAVLSGARFVATNTDASFPAEEELLPGAGAIVAAIERATGRTAEVAGKPHRPMREILRRMTDGGPVWVVGDRPDTDLALARAEGWTAVLALTGVVEDPAEADPSPDFVIPSLADLPELLGT